MIDLLVNLGMLVVALIATYFTGSIVERRHFASLRRREREALAIPVVTRETISAKIERADCRLVVGSCVVGADFFKRHLAALRGLIGGRVAAYESLVDRARREAILRMKDQSRGAVEIACLRITTSNLGPGRVEAMAYGTAVFPRETGAKLEP
jgi:uncharacterized protein YbjQ (UPF0145 family)